MPLTPGDKLGCYEILGPLGAGGMGEVYRARDAKLNREVAIKVLPAALANDADYLARFQREAQALAALQHPHIATIYGLEGNAIVMELVEGAPLRGPLPVAEVIPIARQIAEALEAAHEKGIIHRDLKPGNILVSPSGVVKILDFGLAKAVEAPSNVSGANSPTLTMRATEAGLILGTAGYMAPEQAAGKPVDRRADIWSFGVVLWELIAGKRLFDGETVSHTLAEVLKEPIDLSVIPAGPMRELIGRCLDRNVKSRLQHVGEARIALENYKEPAPVAVARAGTNWGLVAALVTVASGGAWFAGSRQTAPPVARPLVRLHVDLGPDAMLDAITTGAGFAMTPDGGRIAYLVRNTSGIPVLATRLMDQDQLTELPGTENAATPFFSPDGKWIAFVADNKLKKVGVNGGGAVTLCETRLFRGGAWLEDGTIVAALGSREALSLIPEIGGAPRPLAPLAGEEKTQRWPAPMGRGAIVFMSSDSSATYENAKIEALSLATGKRKTLATGYFPHYLPSGHLTYLHQGKLYAVPVDAGRLEATGPAVPVIYDAETASRNGSGSLHVGADGTVVYRSSTEAGERGLGWLDESGKLQPLPIPPGRYQSYALSPDERRIALAMEDGGLAVYDLERKAMSRLGMGGKVSRAAPVWSQSGKHIFYSAPSGIFAIPTDGSSEPQSLLTGERTSALALTPDGSQLYIRRGDEHAKLALDWSDPAKPKPGKVEVLEVEGVTAGTPLQVSRDGRWLAYMSDGERNLDIFVRSTTGRGGKWQISTNGGSNPEWSPNGREILFRDSEARIVFVPFTINGDSFVPGAPRAWPAHRVGRGVVGRVVTDGKRLLVPILPEGVKEMGGPGQVVMLQNFQDELQRKAPVKR